MSDATVSAALRSFAEEPWPHLGAPPPPTRLIFRPRFTIELSPTPSQSVTCCLRTSEGELNDTIAEVRAAVRESGYTGNVWTVGPSSRPAGLAALLRARGFRTVSRPPYEPALTVMALAAPPPAPTAPGVEARLCANLGEFVDALRVAMDAFNEPPEAVDGWLAAAPSLWSRQDGEDFFTHIVLLDGQAVGMGFAASGPAGVMLSGSGVRARRLPGLAGGALGARRQDRPPGPGRPRGRDVAAHPGAVRVPGALPPGAPRGRAPARGRVTPRI